MRRREFLKAAGLTLTLPALESLGGEQDLANSGNIKRLFLMTDGYGFHTPKYYPSATGKDYPSNPVIKAFDPLRKDITLLGNLQHLSGHSKQQFVATGSPDSPFFADSLDQVAARHLCQRVPIESLLLSTKTQATGGSFRQGVKVSMMYDPEEIFDHLFTKGDVKTRTAELSRQQSMLDLCLAESQALTKQVSASDRKRLDEYFNSIRETERVVKKDKEFLHAPPIDPGMTKDEFAGGRDDYAAGDEYFAYLQSQMKFVELAFKFDLTRVAYLWEGGRNHGATHHGNRESSINALANYATRTIESIANTLTDFKSTKMPGGGSLLDETLFVWAAALGSAAGHTGNNAPAILAGGGLPHHGQYVHFDEMQPLTKLHLGVLQNLGVPTERFSDSNSSLSI
jgi:hypothetical protein